jgi:hypothetical protein
MRHLRQTGAVRSDFPNFIFAAAMRRIVCQSLQGRARAVRDENILLRFVARQVNEALLIRRE